MERSKISWCKEQNKGLRLINPNDNLAEQYYKNAEESLRIGILIKDTGSNMWIATHKYYTEYLAAYSILMKIGIKSEIHSCTIEVIKILEEEKILNISLSKYLEEDKYLRIENQYYLKNVRIELNPKLLSDILLNVRSSLNSITNEQIKRIRAIIENIQ